MAHIPHIVGVGFPAPHISVFATLGVMYAMAVASRVLCPTRLCQVSIVAMGDRFVLSPNFVTSVKLSVFDTNSLFR